MLLTGGVLIGRALGFDSVVEGGCDGLGDESPKDMTQGEWSYASIGFGKWYNARAGECLCDRGGGVPECKFCEYGEDGCPFVFELGHEGPVFVARPGGAGPAFDGAVCIGYVKGQQGLVSVESECA